MFELVLFIMSHYYVSYVIQKVHFIIMLFSL